MDSIQRIGIELQNIVTALEHNHRPELIAAFTRLRNIAFTMAEVISQIKRMEMLTHFVSDESGMTFEAKLERTPRTGEFVKIEGEMWEVTNVITVFQTDTDPFVRVYIEKISE